MWAYALIPEGIGREQPHQCGPASSFGIWKDDLAEAQSLCQDYRLRVERIHTHIGSGSDPEVWKTVASMTLDLARSFPPLKPSILGVDTRWRGCLMKNQPIFRR